MSMAPRRKRAGRDKQGGTDLPFSLDVLFEVLLPFPAKELCRLRTACRSWRSLLSNKSFIAAHMKRHQNPFIIVGYNKRRYKDTCRPDNILCDIMDLSGNVVKRIRSTGEGIRNESMVSACGDFICVANMRNNTFQLLNPATGALYTVPDKLAEEHRVHQRYISPTNIVFGQVSSTGEYKVLRVLGHINQAYQLCEVLTLGSSHPRCRAKKSPPNVPAIQKNVVIDSIVYFCLDNHFRELDVKPDYVASFDLETEEWRPTLRGPLSSLADNGVTHHLGWNKVSVASLNGCLAMVDRTPTSSINIWLLMNFEKCLWAKKHNMQITIPEPRVWNTQICPLLTTDDDGRIVFIYKEDEAVFWNIIEDSGGVTKTYDSRTITSTDEAGMQRCGAVGSFTGSLLSVAT